MTDARRAEGGYRGALPPKQDALARPWILAVFVILVLIFALAFAGFPSRIFESSPSPQPSFSLVPSASTAPSESAEATASEEPSASP